MEELFLNTGAGKNKLHQGSLFVYPHLPLFEPSHSIVFLEILTSISHTLKLENSKPTITMSDITYEGVPYFVTGPGRYETPRQLHLWPALTNNHLQKPPTWASSSYKNGMGSTLQCASDSVKISFDPENSGGASTTKSRKPQNDTPKLLAALRSLQICTYFRGALSPCHYCLTFKLTDLSRSYRGKVATEADEVLRKSERVNRWLHRDLLSFPGQPPHGRPKLATSNRRCPQRNQVSQITRCRKSMLF